MRGYREHFHNLLRKRGFPNLPWTGKNLDKTSRLIQTIQQMLE